MSSLQLLLLYGFVTTFFSFILLNKFAASQTLTCAIENQEDKVTRITCPSGSIISDVHFASYGNPKGSCGSYSAGSCHASNSMNIISNECLNKTTCSLTSPHDDDDVFDLNECHNNEARQLLYAEVLCSEDSISSSIVVSLTSSSSSSDNDDISVNVSDESIIVEMNKDYSNGICRSGWTYYNNKCYYFNIGTCSVWKRCNSVCASLDASMLCITDSITNSWIANQLYYNNDNYYSWIGYSDTTNTGYQWVSGCKSSYTNWNFYSQEYANDYAYMRINSGSWYTAYDNIKIFTCSCEYNIESTTIIIPTSAPTTKSPSTATCQSGWTQYKNKCYNFNIGIGYSSSICKSQCASLDASMLCITDSTTNEWITNQIYINNLYNSWIGYSTNTGYKWVSGCNSSYTNWNSYSQYYKYDVAYLQSCYDGTWYASYDESSTVIGCSCEYSLKTQSSSSSSTTSSTTSTSSVIVIIIIIIAVVVLFCCGYYVYFVKFKNNVIMDIDDISVRPIDTKNNQEYGNGNSIHTFPATKINQEYGHISSSFPITSSNEGFPVATNVNIQGYGNISSSYADTSSYNQEYGNSSSSYSVTKASNHQYGYGNNTTVTSSYNHEYGYGDVPSSLSDNSCSSNHQYGYGNTITSDSNQQYGYCNSSSSIPDTSSYNHG